MAGLSIAKATLLASCLRRDDHLEPISRDELTEFHTLLENSVFHCNNLNIQKTKIWLVKHILPSSPRTQALTKYLTTISKNIGHIHADSATSKPCRRQLHLAYLVHDIFHHVQYHFEGPTVCRHVQDHIPAVLIHIFSSAVNEKKLNTTKRLQALLDIWQKERFVQDDVLEDLRQILTFGAQVDPKSEEHDDKKPVSKEMPWVMPTTHGDPKAPYFDLPAANLMPRIVPNSSRPIRIDQVTALHLTPGPADETLVNALKDFLKDIKSIDDPYSALEDEGIIPDIDEMGQISYTNEVNDVISDTYYGWSRAFCEKMKSRVGDDRPSRSNRRSSSRSRSYSRSGSRSRNRSRSRSRSSANGQDYRGKRKRYSRSRSSSVSNSRGRTHVRPHSELQPRRYDPQPIPQNHAFSPAGPPQLRSMEQIRPQALPPPPPPPPPNTNFGMGQFPIPYGHQIPPRPANWPVNLPWPPPPPPPPPSGINFNAYNRR